MNPFKAIPISKHCYAPSTHRQLTANAFLFSRKILAFMPIIISHLKKPFVTCGRNLQQETSLFPIMPTLSLLVLRWQKQNS